jgi:deoxyribose-phosphate aldolase
MNQDELISRIDLTILRPEATSREVHKVVADAMQHHVHGVCVAPVWAARVATMVRGSGVRVCSAVSFPHGTSKSTVKAIEATSTIKDGADEVEVVAHLPLLMSGDLDASRAELMEIVRAARSTRRDVKINVVVETALLLAHGGEALLELAARAVRESGCDCVVTSTGFHPAGGATVEAVRSLKKYAEGLELKAAGGLNDIESIRAMIDAGADRIALTDLAPICTVGSPLT